MKRFVIFIVLVSLFARGAAFSQEKGVYRNISLDSLMVLMQEKCTGKVYYVPGSDAGNLVFNLDEKEGSLFGQMEQKLLKEGYSITKFDGNLLVLKGRVLDGVLPVDFFRAEKDKEGEAAAGKLIEELDINRNVAGAGNKVYQVGSKGKKQGNKALVRGYVRNSRTGEPVIGVGLYDKSARIYAQTDADGFYSIMLPTGARELDVTGYSLENYTLHLDVQSDGELDVQVREKVLSLREVVVSAESSNHLRHTRMGVESIRIEKLKKIPTVLGETDVIKAILTLPGVKSVGEAAAGFNVRGGATDQNLVLYNGATVYNPSHLFGVFSGFNPDIISNIELYKCSIPAEYGGRISSVLDVSTREGNNKEIVASMNLGVQASRAHVEGPISDKTTFIVAGRGTYSDWLLDYLPKEDPFALYEQEYKGGSASFYDMSMGITHKFNGKNMLQVNGYWSADEFKFTKQNRFRYNNTSASVKWKNNISERQVLEVNAGFGKYGYSTMDKSYEYKSYIMSYDIKEAFAKAKLKTIMDENHTLVYGADVVNYWVQPGKHLPYLKESNVTARKLPMEKAVEGALFASDVWNVSEQLSIDYGMRFSMFASNKFYCAPELRLSGRYMINDRVSAKVGFNSMRQYIHMLSNTVAISPTDVWKLSDKDIKPQKGWQLAAGVYASLFDNKIDASFETYYKRMGNYLDYKSGAVLVMNENIANDVVVAKGRAYGAELMLKKPQGKLNGWFSYTYSRTQLKEDGTRGVAAINRGKWYSASFDKPHEAKLVGNYKFTHRLSLSLNCEYATGRPVTVPAALYEYAGGDRLFYSERNGYRVPDYFRMDAAINVEPTHRLKAFTHFSFTVGVYNVTGRFNVYSVYFEGKSGYQMSVFGSQIPYLTLNFKF